MTKIKTNEELFNTIPLTKFHEEVIETIYPIFLQYDLRLYDILRFIVHLEDAYNFKVDDHHLENLSATILNICKVQSRSETIDALLS
jgi:hypothetical protein